MSEIIAVVVGYVLGFFSEPVSKWLWGARIRVRSGREQQYQTRTPAYDAQDPTRSVTHTSIYIRAGVTSSRAVARQCVPYLVGIEKQDDSGAFQPTSFADSMQLSWSNAPDGGFSPIDLPPGVTRYVDIVRSSSVPSEANSLMHCWQLQPLLYRRFFQEPGVYRLSLVVSGEGFRPGRTSVTVRWDGSWESLRVL